MKSIKNIIAATTLAATLTVSTFAADGIIITSRSGQDACTASEGMGVLEATGIIITSITGIMVGDRTGLLISDRSGLLISDKAACSTQSRDGIMVSD